MTQSKEITKISKQLNDYQFETFMADIMLKYYLQSSQYEFEDGRCILITQINNDGGIDAVLEFKKPNAESTYMILQISKSNKTRRSLEKFNSTKSIDLYRDLILTKNVKRVVVTLKPSEIFNTNVECISGNKLSDIILKICTDFNLLNNEGLLQEEFIEYIQEKTEFWSIANKFRVNKDYKGLLTIESKLNSASWSFENYKNYYIDKEFIELILHQASERRIIESGLEKDTKNLEIEMFLDKIHLRSSLKLKQNDYFHLRKLLLDLVEIVYEENFKLTKLNHNYKLIIDPTSTYMAIKLVNRTYQSNFKVVGYFNYLFSRHRDSYHFNFLCNWDKTLQALSKNEVKIISATENVVSDNLHFRGKTYLIKPAITEATVKAIKKLIDLSVQEALSTKKSS
ncbi:hypothetical protein [Natronincola ferrireducens]|uniref:Uncharacterized protein n=1 Tax=Natronincola ferrireducens TaxID=393762 RepID=A0A1G9H9G3_9FIRM|nr:hypothetical protein [Natronincola ferrireducens]SDL09083.1 hypothetical protein SAMN05660472_02580 [Natronincola ferrireducens]